MRRIVLIGTAALLVAGCTGGSVDDGGSAEPSGSGGSASEVRHVVLDTDLAFEDIFALLYLTQRDDVAIDAVTIAGTGEAHCDPGVTNALALLALGGETGVPVACGREAPLQGTNAFPAEWRAAVDDLSMLGLPEVTAGADPRGASDLLLDTLDGDATLITLGPLTNVAEALRADPGLASRVPEAYSMVGAVDVPGNTSGGVAEFNAWIDPVATREVIEGLDPTVVPLDATNDVPYTQFFTDALDQHLNTPAAQAVSALIAANEDIFRDSSFWDTLTTALAFRPELATWDRAKVLVTTSQDAAGGWFDRWDEGAPVRFAASVPDPLAFEREFLSVLTGEAITDVRPAPTVTISFDGRSCAVDPERLQPGHQVVAFEGPPSSGAVLVQLSDAFTYADLRAFLGPDGSVPPDRGPPDGIDLLAFVQRDVAEAETSGGPLAGVCFLERRSGAPAGAWLSPPAPAGG